MFNGGRGTAIDEAGQLPRSGRYDSDDSGTVKIIQRRRGLPSGGRRGWLIRRMLLLADVLGLTFAFLAAELLFGRDGGTISPRDEFLVFLATLPLWVVGAKVYGLYDNDEERTDHSTADEAATVLHFITVGAWILFMGSWISHLALLDPYKFAVFWGLGITLVGLARTAARAFARRRPEYVQNAVIVGAGPLGQQIARKVRQHHEYGINLVGFVDRLTDEERLQFATPTLLGDPSELPDLCARLEVERVIVAHSANEHETLGLARTLNDMNVQVDIVPKLHELISPGVSIHCVEGLPLLGLPPLRLSNSSRLLKRAGDLTVSSIALFLLSPLFGLIALAIKFDSRGPVLFRQIRRGQGDTLFWLYKFRTMVADADERKEEFEHLNVHAQEGGDPRMFKIDGDPRVTRVGRILRRYLLDELPQLVNVWKGEMSLVGPRPLILAEDEHVRAWGRKRLDLKPGMTGLWQVLGRSAISFEEMVKLDYLYVSTWSFGLDIRLLLRTIPLVLKGGGGTY